MTPMEMQGILDAIKAMNEGQYKSYGEYVEQSPRMSKVDPSRQAFDYEVEGVPESKYLLYDYSEPKPYEHSFTENEIMQILDAYSKGKTYRPMQAEPGTPEYNKEVKEKYKVFFRD